MELAGGRLLDPAPPFRYVNHSCDPNCEIFYWEAEPGEIEEERLWMQTIRPINAGEELLIDYIADNDCDETPCLQNDLDYDGSVFQIVDGAVPNYKADIEAAWYLHGSDLESAYADAGVGDNPREHNGMAAIYYYIVKQVREWYEANAERVFKKVRDAR
jgi:hypothetical protein